MAVSTGGIVFGDEAAEVKLEDIQLSDFGRVYFLCLLLTLAAMQLVPAFSRID